MSCEIRILVDADACPVKNEIYKVADRLDVSVLVVSNNWFRTPNSKRIEQVVVGEGMDVADDYIAERADETSVVITADILLAERCIKTGATAIAPDGKPFTADSIGSVVATRNLMDDIRTQSMQAGGAPMGGGRPFSQADRSRFLSALDAAIIRLRKA